MKGLHMPTLALSLPKVAGSLLSIILALVVGGCSSLAATQTLSAPTEGSPAAPAATLRPVPTVTPPGSIASATPGPKVPASVTPTPAALETATPLPRASATSSQPAIQFDTLRMFPGGIGWGFDAFTERLLRTTDNGSHWHNVSPPGYARNSHESSGSVFFLDQNHGWLVKPSALDQTLVISTTVWSTSDGGATWVRGQGFTYRGEFDGGELTFIDAQHGWYRADLGGQMGVFASAIFRTTDGGQHWGQVMLNSAASIEPTTPGSFPPCAVSGLTFLNATQGWATGSCDNSDVMLYATQDGGVTWRKLPVVLPTDVPSTGTPESWPPVFVSPKNGVMLVGGVQGPHTAIAYTTADGGQTWRPHPIDSGDLNLIGPPHLDFIDLHTGWFVGRSFSSGDQQLFITHDGGQTWSAVKSNTPPRMNIDFIDAQVGWTWSADGMLMETADGGTTWKAIIPLVVSP
jgi:photosystem II stability/assembly factor-like uncharacterized protein